jgi:hypothetical protein
MGVLRKGLADYLPNPPELCFLSSWDYRREPPAPGFQYFLLCNPSLGLFPFLGGDVSGWLHHALLL